MEPLFKISVKKVKYGKKVTVIEVNGEVDNIKMLAKELKQRLGAGGSIKNGVIEIQGDHRRRVNVIANVVKKHLRRT